MINIDVLILAIFSATCGAVSMWLWSRGDILHYKGLYEKVLQEKKDLMEDYKNRLDALDKALNTNTNDLIWYSDILSTGATEAPTACGDTLDMHYE